MTSTPLHVDLPAVADIATTIDDAAAAITPPPEVAASTGGFSSSAATVAATTAARTQTAEVTARLVELANQIRSATAQLRDAEAVNTDRFPQL